MRTDDGGGSNNGKAAAVDFVSGAIGATASVYVGQPLDTVKVKMQTFPHLYPNLGVCFRETWKKDGLRRGLYAGTVPSLAANIAENSILFASYGLCQKAVAKVRGNDQLDTLSNGVAGSMAAFFAAFALCPTELVKCRLQALRESHLEKGLEPPKIGPLKITVDILKSEGIPGLFRGLTPTFAREMPGYFFFFFTYEFCREVFRPEGKTKDEIGPLKTVVSGGMAGVALWTAVFPADVIKSRHQVMNAKEPMLKTASNILRTEGVMALYNGLAPTLLRTFPATGALFLAYETSKKLMTEWLL